MQAEFRFNVSDAPTEAAPRASLSMLTVSFKRNIRSPAWLGTRKGSHGATGLKASGGHFNQHRLQPFCCAVAAALRHETSLRTPLQPNHGGAAAGSKPRDPCPRGLPREALMSSLHAANQDQNSGREGGDRDGEAAGQEATNGERAAAS